MTTVDTLIWAGRSLPDMRSAHWPLRIMLAAFIFYQGISKAPISADDAESFGVPLLLWGAAAFGEMLAGVLLIAGGVLINNFWGDLMTRVGGLMLAVIVVSVLVVVYWAPISTIFLANQFHLLLLAGGLYFFARGNAA
ncbi:MAG: hypothetical protein AAF565_09535 [Pseudomonadota bacterium]